MSRGGRLISNTAILGAGTFASKVLVFLLMPLYTSILSTTEFGVADILTQTANLLIPLAAVGICDGLFRFALDTGEENGGERRSIFTSAVLTVLVGGAVTLALIQILRVFAVFDGYILLVAAYVLCANLHSIAANFLRAIGKTGLFALQGIINTALTVGFNILFLVVFDMGTTGYVLSVVLSDLCITVGLFAVAGLYRYLSVRSFDKATLRAMLKYSIPYIPTTIMWLITSASDRYIVTAYRGAAENGLYAAAYKLPTLLILVCGVFIEAWQFSVVKDADENTRSDFFSSVWRNYMGIIFMGASVIIAGARILTGILLADSYFESWVYVPVLCVAMVFSAFVSFMGSVYFLEKKSVMSMVTSLAGAMINVVLNFMLIPERGAMGAAVATLISYLAVFIIRAYDTRYYVKFNMKPMRLIINTALILAQMAVMIMSVPYWEYMQIGFVALILVINGREIVMTVAELGKKMLKKSKKI